MLKWICCIIPLLLVFAACNNTAKNKEGKAVIGDTAHYYPLSTYLEEQMICAICPELFGIETMTKHHNICSTETHS